MTLVDFLKDEYTDFDLVDCGSGSRLCRAVSHRAAQSLAEELRAFGLQKNAVVVLVGFNTDDYGHILQDSGAALVLGPQHGAEHAVSAATKLKIPFMHLNKVQTQGICRLELTLANSSTCSKEDLDSKEHPMQRTGLLLYTSGTTGLPKGVIQSEERARNRLFLQRSVMGYTSQDTIYLTVPMTSATGLMALRLGLENGAHLLLPSGGRFSAQTFWQEAASHGMTQAIVVPTMLTMLLVEADKTYPKANPPPLRYFRSIGAPLPSSVNRRVHDTFGVQVFEMYGSSEVGIATMNYPDDAARQKQGTAGVPLPGYSIRILDAHNEGVHKAGDVGEICVKGDTAFPGYHNRPDAEMASFIDGWFHTGDAGFLDQEGFLTITGRINELINCGSRKFSPNEVDSLLQQHPDVAEAATFAVSEPMMGQVGEAVVVLSEESHTTQEAAPATIRNFLARNLEAFKVPVKVHMVDAIPRSGAQKIQRWKLTEQLGQPCSNEPARPPGSFDVDEEVRQAWGQELGFRPAHPTDNFFGSGGTSMQAAALASDLSSRLRIAVDSSFVFSHPQPDAMAADLRKKMHASQQQGDGQPAGGIRRLSQQELAAGVPVAKTNGGLILMRPIGSRATTAHVGIATELLGPLHVEALRSSHFKLLERHEALRSVFQPRGQGQMPLMRVRPASEQLQQFSVEEAGDEAEAREIAAAAWYGEYDTDQGPLTRLQVVRLSATRHWLILAVHHCCADGISTTIMLRDLAAFYKAETMGLSPDLPELRVQFSDYMAWLRDQEAATGEFADKRAWWREQIFSCTSGIRMETPGKPDPALEPGSLAVHVPPAGLQAMREAAQKAHTTPVAVILAAYAAAAAAALDQDRVAINMISSMREDAALTNVVGCFSRTLPVFILVRCPATLSHHPGNSNGGYSTTQSTEDGQGIPSRSEGVPSTAQSTEGSLTSLLGRTTAALTESMRHSILTGHIIEAAGELASPLSCLCLNADPDMTQSQANFHNIETRPLDTTGILTPFAVAMLRGGRKVVLFLRADPTGGLSGSLGWNQSLLSPTEAYKMADHFQALIKSA